MLFKFPTCQETLGKRVGPTVNSDVGVGGGGRGLVLRSLEKIYCEKKRAQMI